MPDINFKDVSVIFSKKNQPEIIALNKINCTFKKEKTHVVVGFSGSGKSTLLKTLFDGVDYEGDILINNHQILDTSVADRNLGYVSQNYALYPNMTIFENIAFPLKNMHTPREEIIKRVNEIAEELDIAHCLSRKPKQISGGQQQRVALARALVKNPDICLFDEPLSNLDSATATVAMNVIYKCIKNRHMTTIYVTHNVKEATLLADDIYFLSEGEFIFNGTPEEFMNCDDARVQSIMEEK